MNRQNFLKEMRGYLTGKVDATFLEETISYYQDYFDRELKNGSTEEEIAEQLGSPRLLGKTIAQTNKKDDSAKSDTSQKEMEDDTTSSGVYKILHLPKWVLIFIGIIVLIVALFLVTSIISLFLYLLFPILAIIILYWIIKYIIQLFRN